MSESNIVTEQVAPAIVIADGSTWPMPDLREDGIAWRLRYGVTLSSAETARAAAIIEAYAHLATVANRSKRDRVVGSIRAYLKRPIRGGDVTPPTS